MELIIDKEKKIKKYFRKTIILYYVYRDGNYDKTAKVDICEQIIFPLVNLV